VHSLESLAIALPTLTKLDIASIAHAEFFIFTIDDAELALRLGLSKSLGFNIGIIHYLIYLKEFEGF